MSVCRTRFAPSPTGFMHVGNLRTALYAFLLARSQGGKFVLRIEDTDQARYVDGAVQVIYDTLKTAGLTHDEGPDVGGNFGPYIQSERKSSYKGYAEQLVKSGHAYYCFCDKADHDGTADETEESTVGGYDGHCRNLTAEEIQANLVAGKPYVIRQKINRDGSITFHDMVFGDISIENKVLDDQILLKSDGMPTYNFANVVDDHLMNINYVVRGAEYLSSTPKYNLLYQAFGWEIPAYVHLPLIMGRAADGTVSKLSKRHGSVSFANLTAEGYLPEAIVNYIALLGWSSKTDREIFSLAELCDTFNIDGLNKAPAVFDYEKLKWMNGEYLHKMPLEAFADFAKPYAKIEGTQLEQHWPKISSILHQRTSLPTEIPSMIGFLHQTPEYSNELYFNKKAKSDPEIAGKILTDLLEILNSIPEWTRENISAVAAKYAEQNQYKLNLVMWAPRIALAGLTVTPGGALEIMDILGKDESIRRIQAGIDKLKS